MFDSLFNNPVYLHLAINHLPVIGMMIAWIVLAFGAVTRDRACAILGMILVCGTAASTVLVVSAGEEAYQMVLPVLDGPARERLDLHADVAGEWIQQIYGVAGIALLGTLMAVARPSWTTPAASLVGLLTIGGLLSAGNIAKSGGEIRHPAFARETSPSRTALLEAAPSSPQPPVLRLLTSQQYREAIAGTFGPEIGIPDRFPPELRRSGLIALGRSKETITPSGMERYIGMATTIAQQAMSDSHREGLLQCDGPGNQIETGSCEQRFLQRVASQLFRREVLQEEIVRRGEILQQKSNNTTGELPETEAILTSLLLSPEFLFRIEELAGNPSGNLDGLLSDETLATKISYLLVNDAPDEELRRAATRGELQNEELLANQVDRLLNSPRVREGLGAFFADMFRLRDLPQASKDVGIYPAFDRQLVEDAREQTLLVVLDHVVDQDLDYRDLFTTPKTYLNRTLGPIYRLPVYNETGWEPREFPPGHLRSGILSHPSFHLQHSHEDRSSATLRGQFVRETFLCKPVPPAPADVDFSLFDDDENPAHATARDRLVAHSSEGSCRACHRLTDPIGLGLEAFDAVGQLREYENGAIIDVSGELDGVRFESSAELGIAIRNHPELAPCLVETLYRYASGREISSEEAGTIQNLQSQFADSGYRILPLLRAITTSEGFRQGRLPDPPPVLQSSRIVSQIS